MHPHICYDCGRVIMKCRSERCIFEPDVDEVHEQCQGCEHAARYYADEPREDD